MPFSNEEREVREGSGGFCKHEGGVVWHEKLMRKTRRDIRKSYHREFENGNKSKLSMGMVSVFARVAWPLLLLTIFVYCWLLVESLSYKHHVTTRHTEAVYRLQRTNITPSNRTVMSQDQNDQSNITERFPLKQPIDYVVTRRDEQAEFDIGDSLYLNEVIDKHEYRYIHNPSSFCRRKNRKPQPIFLLIIVATAPTNSAQRNALRSTYGAEYAWPRLSKGVIVTVFLLGVTGNSTLQDNIDKESDLHGDIIQEDFVDSYNNLTIKTVMGFKWVTNHCRHAHYVIKCDDDSVVIQQKFFAAFFNSPSTSWAAGNALFNSPVARNISEKFFVSKEFYPSPTYPPYLNGPGYILSTDLVEAIYKVAIITPLFPWEDVFIGMCLQKLNIVPNNVDNFLMYAPSSWPVDFQKDKVKPYSVKRYSLMTNIDPRYIPMIWEAGRITSKKY